MGAAAMALRVRRVGPAVGVLLLASLAAFLFPRLEFELQLSDAGRARFVPLFEVLTVVLGATVPVMTCAQTGGKERRSAPWPRALNTLMTMLLAAACAVPALGWILAMARREGMTPSEIAGFLRHYGGGLLLMSCVALLAVTLLGMLAGVLTACALYVGVVLTQHYWEGSPFDAVIVGGRFGASDWPVTLLVMALTAAIVAARGGAFTRAD